MSLNDVKYCGICNNIGKYRCPSCLFISCSLICCNKHKTINNCNGKRDDTKYIKKNEMSTKTLHRDFFFFTKYTTC